MRSLLILLALAGPLAAETRQHGNLLYDIPPGWELGGLWDDGAQMLRSELPGEECEYCRIYLSPGKRTGGKVVDWVASQSRRFVEEDASDRPEVTPMTASDVTNIRGRPGAMLGQKVDGDVQILLAIQLFGRMELVAFEGPAGDPEELAATMRVFERDVMPLVEGLRFVSEGAAPLLPAPTPGPLSGVWWGTSTWWSMGLDGMMTMEIDHHWLTFWPGGLFYDGTPPNGTADFDPASLLDAGDMDWGSYLLDGGKLTLHYASGIVETYEAGDDEFTKGDRTMFVIQPLADGTKLNGIVSTIFVSGFTPGIGVSGGMTSMTDTRYNPDGTWEFGSWSGASSTFDNGTGFSTSAERSESGRYEVKDGLVIRYAEDGSIARARYVFKAGDTIWIGSDILK